MKLPRKSGVLIMGVTAIASALLMYESTRGKGNVYFLGIYAGGLTFYDNWTVGPSSNQYGFTQYEEGWWNDPSPHPVYTEVIIASHRYRVKTPYSLIGTSRLVALAAKVMFLLAALAALLFFITVRPSGSEAGRGS
jgi:hypothetical protein